MDPSRGAPAPHKQVAAETAEIARGFLWAQPGLDGMGGSIYACADAESFAAITAAIDAAAPRPANPDAPGAPTRAQQRLEGLLALCEAGLGGGGAGRGMRPRPRIVATVDLATLRERHRGPAGRLLWGMPGGVGHLSEVAMEVLSCDAEVQAVLFEGARAIAVGERCRTVTDAARRAVAARDQGCRFPGCHAPVQWTDCHHVERRPKGSTHREPGLVVPAVPPPGARARLGAARAARRRGGVRQAGDPGAQRAQAADPAGVATTSDRPARPPSEPPHRLRRCCRRAARKEPRAPQRNRKGPPHRTRSHSMRRSISAVTALSALVAAVVVARPASAEDLYPAHQLRSGGIHFHTAYSDGAARTRPADAYAAGRAAGMDFMAVTEHSEWLSAPVEADEDCLNPTARPAHDCVITTPDGIRKWDAQGEAAAAATTPSYLALRGFEWSSPYQGHVVVLGTAAFSDAARDAGITMHGFYGWLGRDAALGGGSDGVAMFAHPGREAAKFENLRYDASVDAQMVGLEVFNRASGNDYFAAGLVPALDRGWHVGAAGASDDHGPNWARGDRARTTLVVPDGAEWNEATVLESLRARRFYATHKHSLQLAFRSGNAEMGSRIEGPAGATVPLTVDVWDPAPGSNPVVRAEIYSNGGTLVRSVTQTTPGARLTFTHDVTVAAGAERWYVVKVITAGERNAYSSPIWVRDGLSRP